MEVVDIEDHGVVPLPPASGNYTAEAIKDPANVPHFPDGPRQDLKPVSITQPEGTSFTVDGHEVRWQKWRFQVGFTPREGLVLHLIRYEDRPVVYRASLAEMFIPYGDPNPSHYRKNVFDMGEYGIGVLANSLELGCDCLGEIRYFDAWLNDNDGHAQVLRNAICLHEEDHGISWKHMDWRTGGTEVRRSRRLVISMIATVGPDNPHGNAWIVRQTPLARESQAQRLADGRSARYWRIINPNRPNGLGDPVAYKLVPQDSVLPFLQPDSQVIRRAQFATKHLWVTAYDPAQRFPAGDYPNQHPGGDGLPAWTAADRPLENTDVVLWHTFTAHHVVRPEDWPVMPVTTVGFKLRADGFFDGNPALDLPPAEHC
jgi:Cu2+-containing amine oxidase